MEKVTFNGVEYNARHGGPFDRGSADSYYGSIEDPHYYVGATAFSERISKDRMTPEAIVAYMTGYEWNEKYGHKKDYE